MRAYVLALHCKYSICLFNSFLKWELSPLFLRFFSFVLKAIDPSFKYFSQMENQTVVSTMFWPWIAGNLSVVSIPLSHGKSNRFFNNVLAFSCKQSIIFSILFPNGKSNHCFNNFFGLAL